MASPPVFRPGSVVAVPTSQVELTFSLRYKLVYYFITFYAILGSAKNINFPRKKFRICVC